MEKSILEKQEVIIQSQRELIRNLQIQLLQFEKQLKNDFRIIPSYTNYMISESGRVFSRMTSKELGVFSNGDGYLQIRLVNDGGVKHTIAIHRLVAGAFLGPCPVGLQVAHLDGLKTNNHYSNLKYVTARENTLHKIDHGTMPLGEKHHGAKFRSAQIKDIRRKFDEIKHLPKPYRCIASEYGVRESTIYCIISGKTWKHVI